ncbi:glycosyltransferase family 2 protein [Shewanella xiamenensis]|uniref:glycosyltransferase family 2 protein n=1 Tax=Shewanella xiamenensis TaxID=332186 RepID=UPI0021C0EC01|nr:glycosyltransferase family 2 protein [Shewanella xiamenensis]MCT8864529.1 glycosyltransferase [Shewanella xiamenensis]
MFSIIMPVFNASKTIRDSIQSVLMQTFTDFELLIVDDGSHDSSIDICNEYSAIDSRVKILKNVYPKGAAGARNTGVLNSSKRFICFLDSDDCWVPKKLELQKDFFETRKNTNFIYSDYYVVSSDFNFLQIDKYDLNEFVRFRTPDIISLSDLKRTCSIGCLTVCYDTSFFGKQFFPYTPKEDFALWLKLLSFSGGCAERVPQALGFYRISSKSLSSNKFKEFFRQAHVLLTYGNVAIYQLPYYLCFYAFHGFFKYKSK